MDSGYYMEYLYYEKLLIMDVCETFLPLLVTS